MATRVIFPLLLLIGIVYGHQGGDGYGLHKYGPAPLGHDGQVIDTPEVAKIKKLNYEAYVDAVHKATPHRHHRSADEVEFYKNSQYHHNTKVNDHHGSTLYKYNDMSGYKYDGYNHQKAADHKNMNINRHRRDVHQELVHGVYLPYTPEVAKARYEHLKAYHGIKDHLDMESHHHY